MLCYHHYGVCLITSSLTVLHTFMTYTLLTFGDLNMLEVHFVEIELTVMA